MGKMQGLVKSVLVLQIVVSCTAGLSLLPASDLTVQNFSLVCDLQGATWTSTLLFYYDGTSAGGCGSPPNPTCASTLGTITTSNDQTATLTLTQSNILTVGNAEWTCTHASQPTGRYNATVIAVCSDGVVKQEDKKLDIRCSCGYPSVKATLEYKDGGDAPVNTVDLENSTSSGCVDTRAMDFSYQISDLPSAAKVCVAFTTLYQVSTPVEICIDLVTTTAPPTTTPTATTTTTNTTTQSPPIVIIVISVTIPVFVLIIVCIIVVVVIIKSRKKKKCVQKIEQLGQSNNNFQMS